MKRSLGGDVRGKPPYTHQQLEANEKLRNEATDRT